MAAKTNPARRQKHLAVIDADSVSAVIVENLFGEIAKCGRIKINRIHDESKTHSPDKYRAK